VLVASQHEGPVSPTPQSCALVLFVLCGETRLRRRKRDEQRLRDFAPAIVKRCILVR